MVKYNYINYHYEEHPDIKSFYKPGTKPLGLGRGEVYITDIKGALEWKYCAKEVGEHVWKCQGADCQGNLRDKIFKAVRHLTMVLS